MEPNKVLNSWEELKELVKTVELDIAKNSRGVVAAGVRARRGLRAVRDKATELIKLTISGDKEKKEEREAQDDPPAGVEVPKSSSKTKAKKLHIFHTMCLKEFWGTFLFVVIFIDRKFQNASNKSGAS